MKLEVYGKPEARTNFNNRFRSKTISYRNVLKRQGLHSEMYKWELIESFKVRPDLQVNGLQAEITSIVFLI